MKCPEKKELIVFYYGELSSARKHLVEKHLSVCERCAQSYEQIKTLCGQLAHPQVQLSSSDYTQIIDGVREKLAQRTWWQEAKEWLTDVGATAWRGFTYRPQLIPVLVVTLLVLVIVPLTRRAVYHDNNNFDILAVEIELSENYEWSVFDDYEDEMFLIEELVIPEHSTLRNMFEAVHRKT